MNSYERLHATGVCQADEHHRCSGRFRNWDTTISACTCPCHSVTPIRDNQINTNEGAQ